MGQQASTGLVATTITTPQFTFLWSASVANGNLQINVSYGGSTETNNGASATIPWGNTTAYPMLSGQNNPAITVDGTVSALFSADQQSYVVTFSGSMVEPGVINVSSSGVIGAGQTSPIIVAAYLAS
jgi:hypothetical protein